MCGRVKAFLYLLGSNLFWGGQNYSWSRTDSGSRGVTAIRSVVGSYVVFEATVYSKYLLKVHLLASSKAAGMSCSNEVEGQAAEWRCLASLATAKRAGKEKLAAAWRFNQTKTHSGNYLSFPVTKALMTRAPPRSPQGRVARLRPACVIAAAAKVSDQFP